MKPDKRPPLVTLGQGDNLRTISEEAAERGCGVPWQALVVCWLAFATLAWLWSLAKRH